jgi:hypothetical protein
MEGPWVPGKRARFEWTETNNPDKQRIRDSVQDGGKHLYILRLPFYVAGTQPKVLAEAYYPHEAQSATWTMLDPRQQEDWDQGRLVVIATVPLGGTTRIGGNSPGAVDAYFGELTQPMLDELQRNNRNSKKDLKRNVSAHAMELAIRDAQEHEEEQRVADMGWGDSFVEAHEDTKKFGMNKPRISGYNGGAAR